MERNLRWLVKLRQYHIIWPYSACFNRHLLALWRAIIDKRIMIKRKVQREKWLLGQILNKHMSWRLYKPVRSSAYLAFRVGANGDFSSIYFQSHLRLLIWVLFFPFWVLKSILPPVLSFVGFWKHVDLTWLRLISVNFSCWFSDDVRLTELNKCVSVWVWVQKYWKYLLSLEPAINHF